MYPCEDCHRPIGVHCCHNCKKDANKCGEYHGCGSCNAWENGVHTNADRIRAMSDEELADYMAKTQIANVAEALKLARIPWEQYPDLQELTAKECLEWLQQPAED